MAFVLFMAVTANAEEFLGFTVYPGAKKDEATTNFNLKMGAFKQVACYRTKDSVATVTGYYEKKGLDSGGGVQKQKDPRMKRDVEFSDFLQGIGKPVLHISSPYSPDGQSISNETSLCIYQLK
jgi:hypothetical protein